MTWAILAVFWRMDETPLLLQWCTFVPSTILIYAYRYVVAILGSICCLEFTRRVLHNERNIITRVLAYFGQISIGLYIIPIFAGYYIDVYLLDEIGYGLKYILADLVVKLLIGVALVEAFRKNRYTSRLLLGGK